MECTIELFLFWALVQLDCSLQPLVCEASLKMEISGINVAVPPPPTLFCSNNHRLKGGLTLAQPTYLRNHLCLHHRRRLNQAGSLENIHFVHLKCILHASFEEIYLELSGAGKAFKGKR